jgi:hypothetical protein
MQGPLTLSGGAPTAATRVWKVLLIARPTCAMTAATEAFIWPVRSGGMLTVNVVPWPTVLAPAAASQYFWTKTGATYGCGWR